MPRGDVPSGWSEATFERRVNRFAARCRLGPRVVEAHVPNSARLPELLVPGASALLEPAGAAPPPRAARNGSGRRTPWTLRFVESAGEWVSVDAGAANRVVGGALARGTLPEVLAVSGPDPTVRREVVVPWGRCDFVVEGPSRRLFLEVKSSSLVVDGWALWPDSPSERGRRHVAALARLRGGDLGMVLFVVQRPGARGLSPNVSADPAFADTLGRALRRGLLVRARAASVQPSRESLGLPLPFHLAPPNG